MVVRSQHAPGMAGEFIASREHTWCAMAEDHFTRVGVGAVWLLPEKLVLWMKPLPLLSAHQQTDHRSLPRITRKD